ncbi:hypothetical protein LH460_12975 [Laribacter hongkongensis]|nr:hypothetical protein [Laribacter hongkongensis]
MTIAGKNVVASKTGSAAGQTSSSAWAVADAINRTGIAGVSAEATAASKEGTASTASKAIAANSLTINGITIDAVAGSANAATQAEAIAQAINKQSAASGVTASVTNTNKLTLTASDGRDIAIGITGAGAADTAAALGFAAGTTIQGAVKVTSVNDTAVDIQTTAANVGGFANGTTTIAAQKTGKTLALMSVATAADASDAIKTLDAALKQVNTARADLGAVQNRFTSTITSLQTTSENLSASRSRIKDADFAAETANLSRNQVLQQAGTAMLAQANQGPQIALQLLR